MVSSYHAYKYSLLTVCVSATKLKALLVVVFMDYSIVRIRERFVEMYTLRLGVLARDLEEL